jgi:hypothetical protein
MKLAEIRERLVKKGAGKLSNREIIANWLAHDCCADFNIGLTLMPEKLLCRNLAGVRNIKGNKAYRHLSKQELEQALIKFVDKLNRAVHKNAYKRYGKKLDLIMVIEGENNCRDLHAHFAIKKPSDMQVKEFAKRLRHALELSGDFAITNPNYDAENDSSDKKYRYKLDIIDRDWLYYITKELDKRHVDNLYFL